MGVAGSRWRSYHSSFIFLSFFFLPWCFLAFLYVFSFVVCDTMLLLSRFAADAVFSFL